MKRLVLHAGVLACVFGTHGPANGAPVRWPVDQGGNGHFYEAVAAPSGVSWSTANNAANTAGGYLATITSEAENEFIFGVADSPEFWSRDFGGGRRYGPWLGAIQPPGSPEPAGNWQWVTGEPFGYSSWHPDEPNEYQFRNEDRISYWGIGGRMPLWNDVPGEADDAFGRPAAYVIETIPEPSTIVLLLAAAASLLGLSRQRRRCHLK